jgi:hypothetical protein
MPGMLRSTSAAATLAAAAVVAASASAAPTRQRAHAARSISVRDEGHLGFVRSSGSQILDQGKMSGSLSGYAKVRFTYNGEPMVYATFTIDGSGWTISGHGSGRLSSPTSTTPSFRGSLSLNSGSGRYRHAHGGGELFGVFNRRSYALTVQAVGKLRY